jgi:hypothetical protein
MPFSRYFYVLLDVALLFAKAAWYTNLHKISDPLEVHILHGKYTFLPQGPTYPYNKSHYPRSIHFLLDIRVELKKLF